MNIRILTTLSDTDYTFMRNPDNSNPHQTEFLCRQKDMKRKTNSEDDEEFSRIPDYKHTRVVTFKEVSLDDKKHTVVSCSCLHFVSRRCLCRHIYCVIDVTPKKEHFYPDCFKLYEVAYAENGNEDFTARCDIISNLYDAEHGIVFESSMEEYLGNMTNFLYHDDIKYYNVRLNVICDVNPLNTVGCGRISCTDNSLFKDRSSSLKKRKTTAFNTHLKDYSVLTSLVTNEEESSLVRKYIHYGIRDLLAQKIKTKNHHDVSNDVTQRRNQLASFPNMETQKSLSRLKPRFSPSK